jgi:hypothetical protein
MATDTLVDNQIDAGRELLLRLARSNFDVTAAYWVKIGDEGRWLLYVVSKAVEEKGLAAAYRDAYGELQAINNPWVSLSDLKLLHPHDPIARDFAALFGQRPGRVPARAYRMLLGNEAIEEAYVYPPLPFPKQSPMVEKRRLKNDVQQVERPEDYVLTQAEQAAVIQLMSSGVNAKQAEEWVRKKREKKHPRPPIPAGTIVNAWAAAYWGSPGDDPNPLLMVEAPDGARGLVFKEDTEPAE